ncbi:unnamed protein product, partial [Heterotrigona itama]
TTDEVQLRTGRDCNTRVVGEEREISMGRCCATEVQPRQCSMDNWRRRDDSPNSSTRKLQLCNCSRVESLYKSQGTIYTKIQQGGPSSRKIRVRSANSLNSTFILVAVAMPALMGLGSLRFPLFEKEICSILEENTLHVFKSTSRSRTIEDSFTLKLFLQDVISSHGDVTSIREAERRLMDSGHGSLAGRKSTSPDSVRKVCGVCVSAYESSRIDWKWVDPE